MKRLVAVLLLAVACARRAPFPPEPRAWRDVRSEPCGFTVRMPGRPKVRKGTDHYGIDVTQYSVPVRPGYVYTALCASADQPRASEAAERFVRERLDEERAAVARAGWEVHEARIVPLGRCPGSEIVSVDPKGTEFVTRFLWAGDRSFFLGAQGPRRAGSLETARTMLDSFHSRLCE